MSAKKWVLTALFFVLAIGFAWADEELIDDIKITGLTTVDEKEVLQKISYGVGMTYSKYKTREDIKNLYSMGRFNDINVKMEKQGEKNVLVFNITEKPKIDKIIVKGNKEVSEGDIKGKFELGGDEKVQASTTTPKKDENEKEEKPRIKEDEYFDEYILKEVVNQIEKLYKERNFYYAKVSYTVSQPEEVKGKTGSRVHVEINVDEGDKVKVKNITAKGNNVFSVDKIKSAMKTKEEGWFVSGVFDDSQFIEDLKSILTAYYAEGYVKAKIDGYTFGEIEANKADIIKNYVKFDREKNAINIEIPVTEGIQYKIKSIDYLENTLFTVDELNDKIESRPEKVFDMVKFDRDMAALRNMYAEKGHIFAQIKDGYVYDADTGEVSIKLDITEGPVAYINQIKIRGNYVTKDKVILRELLVQENEPFDSTRIKKSQEAVYNLGFFDNVVIDTEQVSMDKLNLVFEVTERKTNTIGLGAGYSTVEGLLGYVQLTNANLFGEGKSFNADVQFGNTKKSWTLSYKDPWFLDTPTSFGVDVWNMYQDTTYNNQGYDLDTYGLDLSFGRKLNDENKFYVTYRYQDDTYSNIETSLQPFIPEGEKQTSSITPMWVYDSRDDVFDPGKGLYNTVSMQFGGGVLGGDYNYIKGIEDFRYFIPSIWKFVLGIHVKVGNAWGYDYSYGDALVPPTEKFYAGGTDTVRGYEERALGPVEGGNFTIITNIEYKLKLIERVLTFVTFYDSGNSWENADNVDWTDPYLYPAVGVGIRFTIPGTVMLIRLDWGYALDPAHHLPGGKIHFNIGNIF